MKRHLRLLVTGSIVLGGFVAGCSAQDVTPVKPEGAGAISSETEGSIDAEVLSDMDDIWILMTKTRQVEVCSASSDGTDVNSDVVDLYTLGRPDIYGSFDEVQSAIQTVLLVECASVTPLQDAAAADAGAIAQAEWDRVVRDIGSEAEVCEAWRGNGFDQAIMFSAAPAAIERAGFAPDDGKILEFVASYDLIIRQNCS